MKHIDSTGLSSRSLITSLIREDLKCSKLVLGLSELGLDAGKYHLDLSTLVFTLMEFQEQDDHLLGLYLDFMDKMLTVPDVEEAGLLERMAEELYTILLNEKNLRNQ